jgi:ChpA-C
LKGITFLMKKTWVRKTLSVGIMAAGALLMAPAAAQAAAQGYGSAAPAGGGITQQSGANVGADNGTQIAVPVTVPINQNGNADSALGVSSARGSGVNHVTEGGHTAGGGWGNGIAQQSGGNIGILNGNQIAVPVTIPINQCGNADSLLGVSSAQATCANVIGNGFGRSASQGGKQIGASRGGNQTGASQGTDLLGGSHLGGLLGAGHGAQQYGANHGSGLFGGSQASHQYLPNRGGDHYGASHGSYPVGGSQGSHQNFANQGGNRVGGWDSGINQTSFGNIGFLNGTQFAMPVVAPINACGNSLGSLLGSAQSSAICVNRIGGNDAMWGQGTGYGHQNGNPSGGVRGDNGDDCSCKGGHNNGGVRGDQGGYNNGGVRGNQGGHSNGGGSAPIVNDDQGYSNDDDHGDVKGDDNGYGNGGHKGNGHKTGHKGNGNKGNVKGDDNGYGDVKDDDTGYGDVKGGNKGNGNKGNVKGDKGYGDVSPDTYGDKTGGRKSIESTSVHGMTGSLGGLDLLYTLR